jgi:tetratricopeptide (TPR) repeat protein
LRYWKKIEEGQLIFAQARNLEAFILRQQGKLAEAEASLLAAYEADSQNVQVLAHLASVMREAEKYTDLKLILEEALLEHPENEQVLFNYGVVLHDLAQNENSILAMREVVALNPENADALNFIAYTLAEEKRDLDEALKLVQKALEIDPENGYYLDTLGWIQYQSGDYEAARKNLAKAVELSENDVVIMVHYADSLLKTGEESKAIEMYEAALRVANHETTNADEKKSIERATQQLEELAPNSKLANKQ